MFGSPSLVDNFWESISKFLGVYVLVSELVVHIKKGVKCCIVKAA